MLRALKPVEQGWLDTFVDALGAIVKSAVATDGAGREVPLDGVVGWAVDTARAAHDDGNKLIFVGNGGSAGIASHMAADYSKNGNLRALAMNDSSMLTCLGNDFGYEHVFAKQIEFHGRKDDFLVAISSSGRSQNILNAAATARRMGCTVMTLSGFTPDNPLRKLGDRNIFLDSDVYSFVEIGHLALCHAMLDYSMRWPDREGQRPRGSAGSVGG